jgi:hypothetical protein
MRAGLLQTPGSQGAKIFWFFFLKKNFLLYLEHAHCAWGVIK